MEACRERAFTLSIKSPVEADIWMSCLLINASTFRSLHARRLYWAAMVRQDFGTLKASSAIFHASCCSTCTRLIVSSALRRVLIVSSVLKRFKMDSFVLKWKRVMSVLSLWASKVLWGVIYDRVVVNPLGIERGQSHYNLVFSYHGELSCFQVSKYIKYSAYTGCISLCIYVVW